MTYGYIIRDTKGFAVIKADGYKNQKQAKRAAKEALEIMPDGCTWVITANETPYNPHVIH